MSRLTLSCPFASYSAGMRIDCSRLDGPCGHQYFKRCKGWWALLPTADRCPVRSKEDENGKQ